MNEEYAVETPLIELLESVPEAARMWYEHEPTHHQYIPVGRLCHRAARRIKELEAALAKQDSV